MDTRENDMSKVSEFLKTNAGHIIGFLLLAVVVGVIGHSWLAEHDARLIADGQVKAAQAAIDTLKGQQTAVTKAAQVQVTVLQREAEAVKTAPEAIASLPSVTPTDSAPLQPEAIPDAPDRASVLAVPLYQDLNSCKQCTVNLDAETKKLDLQVQIDAEKDAEITTLKKKPGFWHRVGTTAKTVGVGVAIGAVGYAIATR
jgi:hypothetical protein